MSSFTKASTSKEDEFSTYMSEVNLYWLMHFYLFLKTATLELTIWQLPRFVDWLNEFLINHHVSGGMANS